MSDDPPVKETKIAAAATTASSPHAGSLTAVTTAATPAPATLPAPAPVAAPASSAVASDHLLAASDASISSRAGDGNARLAVVTRPSTEEVSALRSRGDVLFGSGDLVSARLLYERAAEGGDGQAALQLGETYDPEFLKSAGITGIRGDSGTARRWYQRAFELGASEAQILLNGAASR